MTPDFLAIGHVAKDLTRDGYVLGGAVTYAALTAKSLGLSAAVVTSCGPDIDPHAALPDIPMHIVASEETTTFVNVYERGRRRQSILGVAVNLSDSDVPPDWRRAPLVLLGPVARELEDSNASAFGRQTVGASIQGWLRSWDDTGKVSPRRWSGDGLLPGMAVAIFSDDDSPEEDQIANWAELCPVLIHTHGGQGCSVHVEGRWHHLPAFPANEVDATGAGDVFAAAYLIRFQESGDPLVAARFASAAASFCVEADGVEGIPTRAQVEDRLWTRRGR